MPVVDNNLVEVVEIEQNVESVWSLEKSIVIVEETGVDLIEMAEVGATGAPGQDGVGDSRYVHNQGAPLTTWVIAHNLGKFPSVTVVDSGGNQVIGEVNYIDVNNLVVEFSVPFGGVAYLN